jgi:hypothetical protein
VYFVFIYTNVCALVAVSVFILAFVPFRVICIAADPAVPFAPSVSLSIGALDVFVLFMPIDARGSMNYRCALPVIYVCDRFANRDL